MPATLFVSFDFVDWLSENVEGLEDRKQSVLFAESLLKRGRIRLLSSGYSDTEDTESLHSTSEAAPSEARFLVGFFLYMIITERAAEDQKALEGQPRFFVEVGRRCHGSVECKDCRFGSKSAPVELDSLFTNARALCTFNVRHKESQFVDFCRVSGSKSDKYPQLSVHSYLKFPFELGQVRGCCA